MHTNIIHTWLHYYLMSYFKCILKKSVIPNVSDSEVLTDQICFKVAGPTKKNILPMSSQSP